MFASEIVQFPIQIFKILWTTKVIVLGYWFVSALVVWGYLHDRGKRAETDGFEK